MSDFLAALALLFVIEGLAYAAFPEQLKRLLITMIATPARVLRGAGLVFAQIGLGLLWLVRGA
ncbi:MAG: DUF2065 domain-containing protein [Azospirillaceae bacterium]